MTHSTMYRDIDYMYSILKDCNFSVNDYDSSRVSFYYSGPDEKYNFVNGISKVNSDDIKLIEDFASDVNMDRNIMFMYKMIGNNREIYYNMDIDDESNTLTFHSFDKIKKLYKLYKSKGQTNYINVAYVYTGMGNVNVATYDCNLGKMFWRPDGGSNGWEKYANVKGVIDMKSEDIKCHTFNFIDIFNDFRERKYNDYHNYITQVDFKNIDESLLKDE